MNTTLSRPREHAPRGTLPQHPPPTAAGHERLSVELPSGDELRQLSLASRLRLRCALWLLERTPTTDARARPAIAESRASRTAARERALTGHETRTAYDAERLLRTPPFRTL